MNLDFLVSLENLEEMENLDFQASKVMLDMDNLDYLDFLAPKVNLAFLVSLVYLDNQVNQPLHHLWIKLNLVLLEMMEPLDIQVQKVNQAILVHPAKTACLGFPDFLDKKVMLVILDNLVKMDFLDSPAKKDFQVCITIYFNIHPKFRSSWIPWFTWTKR